MVQERHFITKWSSNWPHASSTFLGTSAEVFLTVTYRAAMYICTVKWDGRCTIMVKAGVGKAPDVQKWSLSEASTPNVCLLPLDVPTTSAISFDARLQFVPFLSTISRSLMTYNTMGVNLLSWWSHSFASREAPSWSAMWVDVVICCCVTIPKTILMTHFSQWDDSVMNRYLVPQ